MFRVGGALGGVKIALWGELFLMWCDLVCYSRLVWILRVFEEVLAKFFRKKVVKIFGG